jgi:hypothetical protein
MSQGNGCGMTAQFKEWAKQVPRTLRTMYWGKLKTPFLAILLCAVVFADRHRGPAGILRGVAFFLGFQLLWGAVFAVMDLLLNRSSEAVKESGKLVDDLIKINTWLTARLRAVDPAFDEAVRKRDAERASRVS